MTTLNKKKTILIVDDSPQNIDVLRNILEPEFKVKVALNGTLALKLATTEPKPDLILLDVIMPEMNGYELCSALKLDQETTNIPVIFVTAISEYEDETKGLSLGAVDFITKPINPAIVLARIKTHLEIEKQRKLLEYILEQRTKEIDETRLEIVQRLGRAAEYKVNETGRHVIRLSNYARIIAKTMGLSQEWSELLFNAAPLHDIGKLGIPDKILLKPGKLTKDEWKIIQRHPQIGAEIIGDHYSSLMIMAKELTLTHHEKWDGSGYPNGLVGENIPLSGRIIAIADVFDALTTKNVYKPAWKAEAAIEYINHNSGIHFDPKAVDALNQSVDKMIFIMHQYAENTHI